MLLGCESLQPPDIPVTASRAVRHDYTIATTATFADQRIARINTVGVVTQNVVGRLLADCQADVARLGAHALVADYSAASLALDPAAVMQRVRDTIGEAGALAMPTALLVTSDTIEFWQDYSWLMATKGLLRKAFTDPSGALAWAQRQAGVRQSLISEAAARASWSKASSRKPSGEAQAG